MSGVDDKDGPHYAELLRLLGDVDSWLSRIDPDAYPPRPSPGSPLRADDERTSPYQLSHAVWHSLSHAVDHLNCLRTLLRDARVIHMYAPYSLLRSALENASAAVWMLQPARRPERVARRLRFAVTDIHNSEEVKRLTGSVGPRSKHERMEQVRDIAKRAGVEAGVLRKKAGYAEIVEAAGDAFGPGADGILVSWRICSGMTHGDLWPTFGVGQKVEVPGAPPGIGAFKVTANIQSLMCVTTFATHLTNLGWRLYDQRSRAPY